MDTNESGWCRVRDFEVPDLAGLARALRLSEVCGRTDVADTIGGSLDVLCGEPREGIEDWECWARCLGDVMLTLSAAVELAARIAPGQLPSLFAVRDASAWRRFVFCAGAPPMRYRPDPDTGGTLPLACLLDLPSRAGVYLAHQRGEPLYVGSSEHLYRRWRSGHHKMVDLVKRGEGVMLSWLLMPLAELRVSEDVASYLLEPTLNVCRRRSGGRLRA